MGFLDSFLGKPNPDEVYKLTFDGLLPIADKWMESFDSAYSKEFKRFITSDTILGHFASFTEAICGHMGLKDYEMFKAILASSLNSIFGKYFKNDDFIHLINDSLNKFLNDYPNKKNLTGTIVAKMYLDRVANTGPQYYQSKFGKVQLNQTYFFMIENAAINFMNNY